MAPVLERARAAKEAGAHRFCMGWAWREIREGAPFEAMLQMVRGVRELGLEACVTAGMLSDSQAQRLAEAGLTAYNHNLDTSPEHYGRIITTRTYQERLETLARVRQAGVTLCCGGIIGMGETEQDRAGLLEVLAGLDPHPESVPINALVAVEGTPLEEQPAVDPLELVRMVAVARILMPHSRVRLSAGREQLNREAQILCLLAGGRFDLLRRHPAHHLQPGGGGRPGPAGGGGRERLAGGAAGGGRGPLMAARWTWPRCGWRPSTASPPWRIWRRCGRSCSSGRRPPA